MWRVAVALFAIGVSGGCVSHPVILPGAQFPIFESVEMLRSPCYGPCPVYRVRITADGQVVYNGESHVHAKGEQHGVISPQDIAFLSQAIDRVRFQDLHSEYRIVPDGCSSTATDNPTVDIAVKISGRTKHVSYYYGCIIAVGHVIDWLSRTIDEVSGAANWIRPGD